MAREEIPEAPDVFVYADYRTFLARWFAYKKQTSQHYSHRLFARLVGTPGDPTVLSKIIKGKRDLPRHRVADFVRVMELEGRDAIYFELLVSLAHSDDPEERRRTWAAMMAVRTEREGPTIEPTNASLRSSRLVALLSLAECPGFRDDAEWVASTFEPPIPTEEAAAALAELERTGMLVRTDHGLRPAQATRQTESAIPMTIDQRYHQDNHELGGRVLAELFRKKDPELWPQSAFLGFSVAVPAERVEELRGILWDLQLQAMHAAEALGGRVTADGEIRPPAARVPDADRVYHVNVQAFPVTRRIT